MGIDDIIIYDNTRDSSLLMSVVSSRLLYVTPTWVDRATKFAHCRNTIIKAQRIAALKGHTCIPYEFSWRRFISRWYSSRRPRTWEENDSVEDGRLNPINNYCLLLRSEESSATSLLLSVPTNRAVPTTRPRLVKYYRTWGDETPQRSYFICHSGPIWSRVLQRLLALHGACPWCGIFVLSVPGGHGGTHSFCMSTLGTFSLGS